jgi:hypothetical protein
MPATVELTDDERADLVALLKQTIAADPFPLSHRTRVLRRHPRQAGPAATTARAVLPALLA